MADMAADEAATATHIALAPYLPLSGPAVIGEWTLVPFSRFFDVGAVPAEHEDHLRRLVDAYAVEEAPKLLGAVAYLTAAGIAGPLDRDGVRRLAQALLAGALVENPRLASDEEDRDPNAGHAACTAENAVVYGHVLGDGRWHVLETGFLAKTLALTAAEDGKFPQIAPPHELHLPLWPRIDIEIANAAYEALRADEPMADRLERALDWFRVIYSNSTAVTMQVRVGALRSAIEAFLQVGETTKKVVNAFEAALADDDEPKFSREFEFWNGSREFTAAGWWLTSLSKLRNDIVHGKPIGEGAWLHEGHPHFNWGHDYLLELLRRVVANASGDRALLDRMAKRVWSRAAEDNFRRDDGRPER